MQYNFPSEPEHLTTRIDIYSISIISSIDLLKLIANTYFNTALVFEGNEISKYKESLVKST